MRVAVLLTFALAAAAPAAAHPATAVVTDSRGNVFYSDLKHVWRIDARGAASIAVRDVHAHELYLDAGDNLYGEHLWYEGERTDRWGHYVWKRAPDGTVTRVIPATTGFLTNYSFVRDRAGNMYWAGDGAGDAGPRVAVVKRTPAGRHVTHAGGTGGTRDGRGSAAQFSGISWMTAMADGTLFVVDGTAIRRVSPEGIVTTLSRSLRGHSPRGLVDRVLTAVAGNSHHLMGLWPDGVGGVYVANYGGRVVEHVDAGGAVRTVYESPLPHAPTGRDGLPRGTVGARVRCRDRPCHAGAAAVVTADTR
jgi:hypothetical protein